jgi:predicted transcriptional regulator
METKLFALQIPEGLYERLQALAKNTNTDPISLLHAWVEQTNQQKKWLQDLKNLRQQIEDEGGELLDFTQDEVIAQLRQTRQEIFESEYAHLY